MRRQRKLDPWVEGYLDYVAQVRRKAAGTVRDTRCTLRRVTDAMATIRPGTALWKLDLDDYLRWIEGEREQGYSSATLAKCLSQVRGLLDYAWRGGRSDRNVLDGFQLQDAPVERAPRVLTLDEAHRLVDSCPGRTPGERRDRLIVLILYGCGLRTDELCRLRLQDIDRERRELFVHRGKGERQRYVPIPDGLVSDVFAYLLERGGHRGPLFRTDARHAPLSAQHVCRVVSEACARAGLAPGVTPRTLRHTFATHLMDRGVDLGVLASLMGHRSPSETGVYLHALPGRTRRAVGRLPLPRKGAEP